jgi:hypothetical protein
VGRLDTGAGAVCNYWVKGVSDAAKGIGEPASDVNAALFGFGEWPDPTFTEWGLGDGSDGERYWKSLGAWNDGNPVYPKLWYEP